MSLSARVLVLSTQISFGMIWYITRSCLLQPRNTGKHLNLYRNLKNKEAICSLVNFCTSVEVKHAKIMRRRTSYDSIICDLVNLLQWALYGQAREAQA